MKYVYAGKKNVVSYYTLLYVSVCLQKFTTPYWHIAVTEPGFSRDLNETEVGLSVVK